MAKPLKIDEKKLQAIIDFTPHLAQQEIIQCPEREIIVCAGRRFGKSLLAAYIGLKELLKTNRRIWIVAPNYDLTQIVFDTILKWLLKIAFQEEQFKLRKDHFLKLLLLQNQSCNVNQRKIQFLF
jgi:tRNA(Met) C34 N-acetyltransferase TmcA